MGNFFKSNRVWGLIGGLFLVTALFSYKSSLGMPLAVTVVIAPIYEELIFRGWILPKWGIAISSVLFGLWHLKNLFYFEFSDVVYQMAYAGLVLGPVLGWAAMKTKSILPGVVLHYLNNIGSLALMMVSVDWRTLF